MINEQGGVGGRQINDISYDDGYSPPKTVDQVCRLVEQDEVSFIFATIGTPTNTAIARYTNGKKVPLIFLGSGANKWGDPKTAPWVIGWQPSYRTEAQIYTNDVLKTKPDAKFAVLYQNDDFGKDYPAGVRDTLGADFDRRVVKVVSYEVTDANRIAAASARARLPRVDAGVSSADACAYTCFMDEQHPLALDDDAHIAAPVTARQVMDDLVASEADEAAGRTESAADLLAEMDRAAARIRETTARRHA